MPRLIVVPVGKVVHVFLVGAPAVKAAAFTEFRYKIGSAGGVGCAAMLAKSNCTMACISFEVQLVVAVTSESLAEAHDGLCLPYTILRNA